jgi:hypothetical protein
MWIQADLNPDPKHCLKQHTMIPIEYVTGTVRTPNYR